MRETASSPSVVRGTSRAVRLFLVVAVISTGCVSRSAPVVPTQHANIAAYREARERLIARERAMSLGARLVLSADEEAADRSLMALKRAELARGRAYFPPAHSFLREKTKQLIAASPVFEIMRRLPKGGILHAHGGAMGNFRWLVSHASYRPDCYMYTGDGPAPVRGALRLSAQPPGPGWHPCNELRAAAPDAQAFDDELFRAITLGEEDLARTDIWEEFSLIFRRASGLMADRSVRAAYWRDMLERLIDENVQYLESRGGSLDPSILEEVRRRDPYFDVKFIAVAGRSATRGQIGDYLDAVVAQREKTPDLVKGFDLVEEEDRTNTNLFFAEELLAARRDAARRGVTLPLYLHSGESNWAENENLYDAVLLGASRIGHAVALVKHPLLMDIVRARGIALEICPTSNQMLGYIPDLRSHPAVHYINAGIPIVLSPDDAGVMRNSLSHDFYVAFMAWGLDLRGLKQIAMNSLTYSAMSGDEKRRALEEWERRWSAFVTWLNARTAAAVR